MSRELYQRTMLMPIVELSKHKHQLSPLHQSKVKHHYRLSKEERLWKPTNGMVLKTQGQRRQRRQRLKTVPRLNRSWVQSFELESSLFASPAIWGTTKLTEVLQLCGGTQEHAAPARMKSIVAIEIFRQLRDQFGTGSSSSNMHLFRTLASALFPGISPVESSKTLSTNAVIYTHCMVCKIQCNTFNVCHCCTRDTLIKTCYCSECTELLKLCPSCFEPIEMGQHSTRLNLEPKTKQLELVAHTTKNLELFTINHWVQLRSWYDHEHLLIQEINETQARRQEIVAFNQHNLEEKLKGIRVLEKSTKAWQISILGLVFRRWADCLKKLKASAARMTKFFQQLKGTNMKLVMREWSSVVQRLKLEPELSRSEQMDQRIKECTKEIAKRSERIEFLTERIGIQSDIIVQLNQHVIDHEALYLNKDRHPITLNTIIHTLSTSCVRLLPWVEKSVACWAKELTREGLGTYRLGTGNVFSSSEKVQDSMPCMLTALMLQEMEQDGEEEGSRRGSGKTHKKRSTSSSSSSSRNRRKSPAEEEDELKKAMNQKGLPRYGQQESIWTSVAELEQNDIHVDEDVYYPFDTRIGETMSHILDYICSGSGGGDGGGGTRATKHDQYQTLLDGTSYLQVLQSLVACGSAASTLPCTQLNTDHVKSLLKTHTENCRLNDENSSKDAIARQRCEAVYQAFCPSVQMLTVENMVSKDNLIEEDNKEEEKLDSSNGKKVITKTTTIINGEKVQMEDDNEQRHFAFLANVVSIHGGFPSGSPVEGASWKLPKDIGSASGFASGSAPGSVPSSASTGTESTNYVQWLNYLQCMENDFRKIEMHSSTKIEGEEQKEQKEQKESVATTAAAAATASLALPPTTIRENPFGFAPKLDLFFHRSIASRSTTPPPTTDLPSSKTSQALSFSPSPSLLTLQHCTALFQLPTTDLFVKYRTALYDRLQFQDYNNRASVLSWLGCNQALLGRDQQTEEDVDDGTFTGRNIEEQIGDLFRAETSLITGKKGMLDKEIKASLLRLSAFLMTHYRSTVMIFEHYSATGTGGGGKKSSSMDRGEFWKLIKETGLHKTITTVEIDLIFQKSNLDNSAEGNRDNIDTELEGHEFVEAIIRLALCKYKNKSSSMDW